MTAVEFLQRFHPDRTWVLTSIEPSQKGIETHAFPAGPSQAADAADWVKHWNGKRNCYFSVAEPIKAEHKKAERENVASVHWLHVDIDADGSKDLVSELKRIKTLVTTGLPNGVPKPTCVLYSGGGYQAFWRLDQPIPIQGDLTLANEAKRYNEQLEILLGGDSCSNVDRIMRLPFTQNIPNQRKIAKGRVQVEARVESFTKKSYGLTEFTPAVDTGGDANLVADDDLDIPANVARLATVDDLDQWLKDSPLSEDQRNRLKVVIVMGEDPDTPKDGDNSRSAWLFDATCNMLRGGVPDEVIYSVLTDPNFKIAESVLENTNTDKYAKKQIRSGKEAVISPNLQRLNERYAVIKNIGGRCRVIEEVKDRALQRHRLVKLTFTDFSQFYSNEVEFITGANGQPRPMKLGKWWLEHPQRRSYDRLVFEPERETPGDYNLWRGFGYNAIPGPNHESFLEHVRETVCQGNKIHYDYVINWMARTVQKPAQPGHTALVMRGKPGTGKSFLAKHFGRLFGRHFLPVANADHLVGQFNAHLRDAIVVFGDEAFYAGNSKHEGLLKSLITEEMIQIEAKGIDAETCANYCHLIMASNMDWVVPVGEMDRRYFVVDVATTYAGNRTHFAKIARDLERGGYENLLHFLMHHDLRGFNVEKIPTSSALQAQVESSMSPHQDWWFQCLQEGRIGGEVWAEEEIWTFNHIVWEDYTQFLTQLGFRPKAPNKFGSFIKGELPSDWPKCSKQRIDGDGRNARQLPPISEAREYFATKMRLDIDWEPVALVDEQDLPF